MSWGSARLTRRSIWARSAGAVRTGEAHPADRRVAGPASEVDPRLSDLDCGRWRGEVLGGVQPAELAVAHRTGSGPARGESVVALIERVRGWLAAVSQEPRRVVAVTHPP